MNYSFGPALLAVSAVCLPLTAVYAETQVSDPTRNFRKNVELAKRGDALAQLNVGVAYDTGHGVEKDLEQALSWYRKAAAQGDGRGMLQVGYKYEAGGGVEKDVGIAAEWFRKARKTKYAKMAGLSLVRLSRAGLIKDKYVGIPVEGGFLTTHVDLTIPIENALNALASNPDEIGTGKGYWIGYNSQMLSVAARGEIAIPPVLDFIKKAPDLKVRHAGILALYLIGIECHIAGRIGDEFVNRNAREALWALLKVEGFTDEVAMLLKRDPWPADVPAIMDALAAAESDCPYTLNALLRYPLSKRPVDSCDRDHRGREVRFVKPKSYTDRDFVRLAVEGIERRQVWPIEVEAGTLEQIPENSRYGNPGPRPWEGTIEELLLEIKGLDSFMEFADPGRNVYYYTKPADESGNPGICFCTAATAKKRWLQWWDGPGKTWYRATPQHSPGLVRPHETRSGQQDEDTDAE